MNKIFFLAILFFSIGALALSPEKHLEDPKQEQRALAIFKEVKCLVCQGQSIYGSNTEFSSDLRQIIRSKISQGLTDEEIIKHLEEEFGEQILFSNKSDSLLNFLPNLLILLLSAIFLYFFSRNLRKKKS